MISEIQLHNFKCFQDIEMTLGPLTLIAGENGTGKSSIIQSLLCLRQSHVKKELTNGLVINGPLTRLGRGQDVLFEDADDETIGIVLTNSSGATLGWEYVFEPMAIFLRCSRTTSPENPDFNIFQKNFQYLHAGRIGPQNTFPMVSESVENEGALGKRGEFAADFLRNNGSAEVARSMIIDEKQPPTLKYQVEAWLGRITSSVRITLDANPNTDQVELRYSFSRGARVSNDYRPTNVAFGLTYCLPIAVAILSLPPGSLLIVENPEAHLHPRAQTAIGYMLARCAKAGIQVIVETHSEHIVNACRLAVRDDILNPQDIAINFFFRQDNSLAVRHLAPELLSSGRLTQWPKGFFDEWESSLSKLVLPKE